MPTTGEIYSLTGTRLSTDVKDKFGDTGNVQITDAMILRWINNGVRSIVAQNPFLKMTAQTNLIAGQNVYSLGESFTTARVMQWDSITVQGRPLQFLPWAEFQKIIAGTPAAEAEGRPTIASDFGGTLTLWPVPNETIANGLVLYFSAYPAEMADIAATLPLPDRFYNALLDYVHAQALELDDNFEAAQAKYAQHEVHVQRQFNREDRIATAFYPTMVMDPDDEFVAPYITGGVSVEYTVGSGYGEGCYGS